MKHHLKTWPDHFDAVETKVKTFEVRLDDRNYSVGDILVLQEYDPLYKVVTDGVTSFGKLTGRELHRRVTYILKDAVIFGVQEGYVVLAIAPVNPELEAVIERVEELASDYCEGFCGDGGIGHFSDCLGCDLYRALYMKQQVKETES